MASPVNSTLIPYQSRYKLAPSRRKQIQQPVEDHRIVPMLPRQVPEKTWFEILAKEETEMFIFDIREEILDEAFTIVYDSYIERQLSPFTIHCTTEAWLKLVDWAFYRHDPGEDPTNYPPCHIPKRTESWIPDLMPEPSPKDSWAKEEICCCEDETVYPVKECISSTSLDFPYVEDIPQEYWFTSKEEPESGEQLTSSNASCRVKPDENLAADSEIVQKVVDYVSEVEHPATSHSTGVTGSLPKLNSLVTPNQSESVIEDKQHKKNLKNYRESFSSTHGWKKVGKKYSRFSSKSDASNITLISDCQIKNPRMDPTFEITSQTVESSTEVKVVKRK